MMRFRTKVAILLAAAFLSLVVFYRIATSSELDLSRVQKKQMTRSASIIWPNMKPLLMIPHPHKERHEEKNLALPDHLNMRLVGQPQDDRF